MTKQLRPEGIKWKYARHITMSNHSHGVYIDEQFGVQWEQITPNGYGEVGKPKNYFFIDNVNQEFTSSQQMCDYWNKQKALMQY